MSELRDITCPRCSKLFCFKATSYGRLTVKCPGCGKKLEVKVRAPSPEPNVLPPSHSMQQPMGAGPIRAELVQATPVFADPAEPAGFVDLSDMPAPAEYPHSPSAPALHRPAVKSLRQKSAKSNRPAGSGSGLSPKTMQVIGLAVAAVVVLAVGSFGIYQVIRSMDVTSLATSLDPYSLGNAAATNATATEAEGTPANASSASTAPSLNESDNQANTTAPTAETPPAAAATTIALPRTNSSGPNSSGSHGNTSAGSPNSHSNPYASGSGDSLAKRDMPANGDSLLMRPDPLARNSSNGSGYSTDSTTTDTASMSAGSTAGSSSTSPPMSRADLIERAEQSVVRIEVTSGNEESLGSGFVVDNQGTLVTNCHVLAGANRAMAFFPDGRSCLIIGTLHIDESRDIVVARISDTTAPPLAVASSLPRKGEQVTALGAPHGLSFTATNGIISALRPGAELGPDQKGTWIQVDAALSPGNSGGPLINDAGEVVGMSTLASQGSAQNLNFGISSADIRNAITISETATLKSLSMGIAKVEMRESSPSSSGGPGIAEATISDAALADYVQAGIKDFGALSRGLRNEGTRLSSQLKEMRDGKAFIPPQLLDEEVVIARVMAPGQRTASWYFLNEEVKRTAISRQMERIKVCNELKSQVTTAKDADSLFSLLWNFGPKLEMRRNNSIGFVDELIVIHALNEHEVLAMVDETPVLLWAPATTGFSPGEILEGPVYVSGTVTAEMRSGLTASLTVLQLVTADELRSAVTGKKGTEANGEYRSWRDRSGSFAISAKLLGKDDAKVVLQKEDGSIVTVPRSKLSDTDLEWLASQP